MASGIGFVSNDVIVKLLKIMFTKEEENEDGNQNVKIVDDLVPDSL